MNEPTEAGVQANFNIKKSIEQNPFERAATQKFFSKWCEINDAIVPRFVAREEWNKEAMLHLAA